MMLQQYGARGSIVPPKQPNRRPDEPFECECGDPEPHSHTQAFSRHDLADAETPNGQFAYQLARAGILYAREVEFHATRNWRLDFVFPNPGSMLAMEVNGGLFVQGRHTQGAALLREYEKLSEAAIAGYRLLFATPNDVTSGRALDLVQRALVYHHEEVT